MYDCCPCSSCRSTKSGQLRQSANTGHSARRLVVGGGFTGPLLHDWQYAPALAREGDQGVLPTLPALGPGKTAGEDSAVDVAAKLTLHIFRHRPCSSSSLSRRWSSQVCDVAGVASLREAFFQNQSCRRDCPARPQSVPSSGKNTPVASKANVGGSGTAASDKKALAIGATPAVSPM
jgi:hypothetical protein